MHTRAIRIHEHGGPEVMRLEDIELPPPGPGQVLVRHTAIGVNFIDVYHRTGLYPLPLPSGLGSEGAGTVEAIGPDVREVAVGQRVAACTGGIGAYAGARLISEQALVPLPEAISDRVAASAMLKGLTAEYLIRRTFPVRAGQWVLFHAAAGGVGSIAVQWLARLGARVIGTVSSAAKAERARALGCEHAIIHGEEDLVQRVREITGGKGVPVVYDSIGKDTLMRSLECLAPRGMLVSFGNASGKPPPLDLLMLSQKGSLYVTRPTLNAYVATRPELLEAARALFDVIESGAVHIEPSVVLPLDRAAEAHRSLESRATTGSLVLVP